MNEAPHDIPVLLIEDDPDDSLLMEKLLEKSSGPGSRFVVRKAVRLEEAMRLLQPESFAIVLLDLFLPDGRGLETFHKIYELAPHVPIVICSGLTDESLALQAIREGAQDYLVKGQINQHQFATVMRYALERSKLATLQSEFVSMIIHELRSPLVVSKGFVELLMDGHAGSLSAEQSRYLEILRRTIEKLNRVVDNLLDLKKMELGQLKLKNEEVNVCDLIRDRVEFYQSHAAVKALTLTAVAPEKIMMNADAEKLEEVFCNLLSNAIKFTEKGSVSLSACEKDGGVECIVADTGPGISAELIEKLFDKFQQFGKSQRKDGQKGTGLGLAICKAIVTAHGGDIRVESTPGEGTRFILHFPKKKPA